MKYHIQYIIYKPGQFGYKWDENINLHVDCENLEQAKSKSRQYYTEGQIFQLTIRFGGLKIFYFDNLPKYKVDKSCKRYNHLTKKNVGLR